MTRDLYKGLQCSKSREEVAQSYSEGNYTVKEDPYDRRYQAGEYTITWNGVDITNGWADESSPITVSGKALDELAKIPVREDKPKINMCQHNDCGWCYYKGDKNPNDSNGQCNKPESCEVNDDTTN